MNSLMATISKPGSLMLKKQVCPLTWNFCPPMRPQGLSSLLSNDFSLCPACDLSNICKSACTSEKTSASGAFGRLQSAQAGIVFSSFMENGGSCSFCSLGASVAWAGGSVRATPGHFPAALRWEQQVPGPGDALLLGAQHDPRVS